MRRTTKYAGAVIVSCFVVLAAITFGQTISASLSGTVQDPSGAAVPDASVRAIDSRTSIAQQTSTSAEGIFAFPFLQPGTYKVEVEHAGFKRLVKTGLVLNASDKASTGILTLEVGGIAETVEVSADLGAQQIKTLSGEISEVVTGRQIQDLALNGRNILDMMKLIPGVVTTATYEIAGPLGFGNISINGSRQNQHNLTIDGSTNVDTGGNLSTHVVMNMDAIAELKVLTSNYQAEYGRASGGDIKIVTRGGGRQYHGSGYLFHRHEGLNSNTFLANADGRKADGSEINPRQLYRFNYAGYNFGGPVPLTRTLKERLFFFWSQEWHNQLIPLASAFQVRMPTDLEVAGDFSQTRDGNDLPITIRDPLTGKPFLDNKIPASRLSSDGAAILKLFNRYINAPQFMPLFNHNSQISSTYPRRQENIRVDFRLGTRTTLLARYTQDQDQRVRPYGGMLEGSTWYRFPLTPYIFQQGPARNAVLSVTTTLSSRLVNELVIGASVNHLTGHTEDTSAGTYAGMGLKFQPPYPYDPQRPVYFSFSGIPNQAFGGMSGFAPFNNSNTTLDFIDNASKVWGRHLVKLGIFVQRNRKDQIAGREMTINFVNNTLNPNNTGHPYANSLLGNFDSLVESQNAPFQGQFRYTNVEWYIQDNFKVTPRLTLDYGIRFYILQPQYDARLQDSYFNPALWDPKNAVRLYWPAPGNRAVDPQNPSVLLPSYLVGRIVPGSGDPWNGLGLPSQGYPRGGIDARGVQYGPRLGFAYDLFGKGKTVIRGGYGVFYDRISGNALAFQAVNGPPINVASTFNWGNLDTIGASGSSAALGISSTTFGSDRKGQIPNTQNFSLQIQHNVGWATVISIGYVGSLSTHQPQGRNLNYIPLGTLFQKSAQDPSRFAGGVVPDSDPSIPQIYKDKGYKFDASKVLNPLFLRPYPGYGVIVYNEFSGSSNYHSLQVTLNRKLGRNITYALVYSWSKTMDTADSDISNYASATAPTDTRIRDYKRAGFDRRHTLVVNYVWNLPRLSPKLNNNLLIKQLLDNWQISGIGGFASGFPAEIAFPTLLPQRSQSITGSPDYPARLLLTGDPTGSRTRERWLDPSVLRLPDIGSAGYGPRNYLSGPASIGADLSIFKNFLLGGGETGRRIQIRLEMFNALNHPCFYSFNGSSLTGPSWTWNIAADFSDYYAKQQFSPAYVNGTRTGVNPATGKLGRALGEVSALWPNASRRVIQLAAKVYF